MPRVVFKRNRVLESDEVCPGQRGQSLLEVARARGVPMGSNCGGVCGCSTCHVYVMEGLDSLGEMSDREADRLDRAFDVRLTSRLGCQATLADQDVVVMLTEESLRAFFDENPDLRRQYEATGVFPFVPHH